VIFGASNNGAQPNAEQPKPAAAAAPPSGQKRQ
jgi:hypothetical protein